MNYKPMLAKAYDYADPTGWWMSEKLMACALSGLAQTLLAARAKYFQHPQN